MLNCNFIDAVTNSIRMSSEVNKVILPYKRSTVQRDNKPKHTVKADIFEAKK